MKTAVYALVGATRDLYLPVKKSVNDMGLAESKLERSLFYRQDERAEGGFSKLRLRSSNRKSE